MFWEYRQNNSGGSFLKPAKFVFIEAEDYSEANMLFQRVEGCYFDPSYMRDCECCGTRWNEAWEGDTGFPEAEIDDKLKFDREFASGWTVSRSEQLLPLALIVRKNKPLELIEK